MAERTTALPGCEEPLASWDGQPIDALRVAWGVPRIVACRRVGSTNDLARAAAQAGCEAGTCVLADEQTAGRGRRSRAWASPPGLGIWLSLVLRPATLPEPGALPLLVGLGVARALEPFCTRAAPRVKWPNDVLAGDRKLGGILCESAWEGDRSQFVVVGIGLNVLQAEDDFPAALRGTATSVRLAAGALPARAEVAGAVVRSVLAAAEAPVLEAAALDALARRDALRGRRVTVEEPERDAGTLAGEVVGIDAQGRLLVRADDGALHRLHSGTVRPEFGDPVARPRPTAPLGARS